MNASLHVCKFVWLGKPQMRFLQFDKCRSKPTRMRDCCQQTHSTIMARIHIYESIYITYKICMRSFITTRVWHREREGERIRYWQKWNVIVAIHWEIKILRIQSSRVCERECVVRIETLSRAGGKVDRMCENMKSNNNAPTVLSQFTLYVYTFERERNEIGFMRNIFYVCADTKWEAQKWIP